MLRCLEHLGPLRKLIAATTRVRDPLLETRLFDRVLDHPIALAAGFDKDAEAFNTLGALGFSAVEVGTVTAQPQPGNPRPRLFRLPEDRALVNRMGFNNHGALAAARGLARKHEVVIGVNIGKTKVVPPEQAVADYVASAEALAHAADYFVVNVSSPNTPGLRDLQSVEALRPLLASVREALDRASPARVVPLLVKIAPDLADADIDAIADLARELSLDGIIATNTTIRRDGLRTTKERVDAIGAGGLSGEPLRARALEVLRRLSLRTEGKLVLVAAGGISTASDVYERLEAGATLVQVYTGFVYGGPFFAAQLARGLRARCRTSGKTVSELTRAALGRTV